MKRLIILAAAGTAPVLAAVWSKHCEEPATVIDGDFDGKDIREVLSRLLADNEVADEFVLVPGNCIPCSGIRYEELLLPYVLIDGKKQEHFLDRLPISFSKAALVDALDASTEEESEEAFIRRYLGLFATRPVQASFHFGNIVTPVLRANPCENVVLEAILRKKFITANADGWKAIEPLLVQAYNLE